MSFQSLYATPLTRVKEIIMLSLIVWSVISIMLRNKNNWMNDLWWKINLIMAAASFIVILRFTVLGRESEYIQTIPFIRTVKDIIAQPDLVREMVMNVFLFFPFGLTLPYALDKNKTNVAHPVKITIGAALILSCTVELAQFICRFGNAELSDIMMNTLGASIGCISYGASSKLKSICVKK